MSEVEGSMQYFELQDVCKKITDGSHVTPAFTKTGYPFVTVKDVEHDRIDLSNCSFISKTDYDRLKANCNPKEGDILFSKDGTVGKVVEISKQVEFVILSSLAILRPNPEIVDRKFLKFYL